MLDKLKWVVRQRLQFIEFTAFYIGFIGRTALARAFAMSEAAATKDLRLYNDLAPGNLVYSQKVFGFVPSDSFRPVVADLAAAKALPLLEMGLFGQTVPGGDALAIPVSSIALPARLPSEQVLAQVTRAIHQSRKLRLQYHSLRPGSDSSARIIEPHALVNSGLRWHVRAYNARDFDFRDFVLSRVSAARCLDEAAESASEYDEDWVEQLELQLAPHPGLDDGQRAGLLLDYGARDDQLRISLRRALVGYALQQLAVDTTRDHGLPPRRYPLVLLNREEVESFAAWALL